RDSSLQIASTDAVHPTSTVALTGTGLAGTLALDSVVPATGLDLGTVPIGGTSSFVLALRDDGNVDLAVTADVSPVAPQIALDTTVTVALTVDPQVEGTIADHITVTAGASALAIPVFGKIVTPGVSIPPSRALGSFCVDQPTSTTTLALEAAGTASIQID